MAGIILLGTMTVGGITMWWKRKNELDKTEPAEDNQQENI